MAMSNRAFRRLVLGLVLAAPTVPSTAQDAPAINSSSVWGWQDYGQAECLRRGAQALDSAAAQAGIAATAQPHDFYVDLLGDTSFQAAVLCIAENGTQDVVSDSPRVMVGAHVSTSRAFDAQAIVSGIAQCIYDEGCPAAAPAATLEGSWIDPTEGGWGTIVLTAAGPDSYGGTYSTVCEGSASPGNISFSASQIYPGTLDGVWGDGTCAGRIWNIRLQEDGTLVANYINDYGPYAGSQGESVLTRQ